MDGWLDSEGEIIRVEAGRLSLPSDFLPPPVRLASREHLAAAARDTPAMTTLRAFVDWVGKGRSLNDDGDLAADAVREVATLLNLTVPGAFDDDLDVSSEQAEAQLIVDWAVLAGFVYQRGPRLYRTGLGKDLDRDPLAAWHAVFESRLEMGVVDLDGNGPPWGATVDDAMADLVVVAHLRTESMTLREVVDDLCEQEADLLEFTQEPELGDGLREAIAEDVHRMVEALTDLGVIALEDGSVRCTKLGAWASVALMRSDGIDVRVVEEYKP